MGKIVEERNLIEEGSGNKKKQLGVWGEAVILYNGERKGVKNHSGNHH